MHFLLAGSDPFVLQFNLNQPWDWQKNIFWVPLETTANPSTVARVRQAMITGLLFHGPYSSPGVWTHGGTISSGNETFLEKVKLDAFMIRATSRQFGHSTIRTTPKTSSTLVLRILQATKLQQKPLHRVWHSISTAGRTMARV